MFCRTPSGLSSLNFAVGPDTRWHQSVSPTLVLARLGNATASLPLRGQPRRKALRSYPAGQVRRKEKGCHYISASQTSLDLLLAMSGVLDSTKLQALFHEICR